MINYNLLKTYQLLIKYSVINHSIKNFDNILLGYSKEDNSPYWNFALVKSEIEQKDINKIEEKYKKLKRNSTIYIEEGNTEAEELLKKNGYSCIYEDSWLIWDKEPIQELNTGSLKIVSNKKELKTFIDTYRECFLKDDEQNPYGEPNKNFLRSLEKTWKKYHNKYVEYYLIYKDKKPVAVSELIKYNGMGYITSVGSKKSVRGEGYGKKATYFTVNRSLKENLIPFLGTEEGYYPNEFYKRIGFSFKFKAGYFQKITPT